MDEVERDEVERDEVERRETMFYQNTSELIELLHRVLRDTVPEKTDAAVLFIQTADNDGIQIDTAAELYHSGKFSFIAVCGYEGKTTESFVVHSSEYYKQVLVNRGVPEDAVIVFERATELPPCTDAEARGVVRLAKLLGWRSLMIVVPPLHAVRAFVSTIAPALREYPELRVYNYPVPALSWIREVRHSETVPNARRADQLRGEFEKMERYYEKCSHLSAREVLDYLNQRDREEVSKKMCEICKKREATHFVWNTAPSSSWCGHCCDICTNISIADGWHRAYPLSEEERAALR